MSGSACLKYQEQISAKGTRPFVWSPWACVMNTAVMSLGLIPRRISSGTGSMPISMKYLLLATSSKAQEQLRLGSGTPWLDPKNTTFILISPPKHILYCFIHRLFLIAILPVFKLPFLARWEKDAQQRIIRWHERYIPVLRQRGLDHSGWDVVRYKKPIWP